MKTDIVLIDSGINNNHPTLEKSPVCGINLTGVGEVEDIQDRIGHGTAVYSILHKFAPSAHILPIKIFDYEFSTDFDCLAQTLEYVYSNIECKIIHLSNGVTYCHDIPYFFDLCCKIRKKGILIVAAFDNGGAISYPAAFPNVIGVDWSKDCRRFCDYEYFEGSIINFRGIGTEVRVPWLENSYKMVGGASFAAPYITAQVFLCMERGMKNMDEICVELKCFSKKQYFLKQHLEIEEPFHIENAVIFPFNKEMHSLLRYEELLTFNIKKVLNYRYLGNIGLTVSEATNNSLNSDKRIFDYEELDWETKEFDCFILGHTENIGGILGKNFICDVIKQCINHHKNLYCFDDLSSYNNILKELSEKGLNYYYPHITAENIPKENCGKLRHIGKPVIGVWGTSPRQGKYTLQLALRQLFLNDGYKVGQLGTEPTALLFGMEACYPVGYSSTVHINGSDAISVVNYLMGKIEDKNPDIILVGGQSQTIPLTTGNLGLYTVYNQELLLACEPDICLLCINYTDEIAYIERTVRFIESYIETKVLALVLFPLEKNLRWSVLGNRSNFISEEAINHKKEMVAEKIKLPIYLLNDEDDLNSLYQNCISFFEAEEIEN